MNKHIETKFNIEADVQSVKNGKKKLFKMGEDTAGQFFSVVIGEPGFDKNGSFITPTTVEEIKWMLSHGQVENKTTTEELVRHFEN